MNWKFHNPVAVHFGRGQLQRLRDLVPAGPLVLVLYPQASPALRQQLAELCGARPVEIIDDVPSNPDLTWCRKVYWDLHAQKTAPRAVVAVGGGSVIDAAKVLAVRTESGGFAEIEAHLKEGGTQGIRGSLPLYALPTTAGTGSEVTPWATVWDFTSTLEGGAKYSLHLASSWSQAAIVDPHLGLGLPLEVMRNSALDALSHSLETIWNVNANPVSDQFALAGARGVLAHLPKALAAPGDLEARSGLAKAALLAGLAFSNTKTALAHSLSYPMTLKRGLPHGLACSFTLPLVWRLALGRDDGRDRLLAQVIGAHADEGPEILERFLQGVGVATRFSDYGVDAEEADRLLAHAFDGVRGRNFIGTRAPAMQPVHIAGGTLQ